MRQKLRINKIALTIFSLWLVAGAAGWAQAPAWSFARLGVYPSAWDMVSDLNNNLHIIWLYNGALYYSRIVNFAIQGSSTQQVPTGGYAVGTSFTRPRLAVRNDGQTVHIVWGETYLVHSWRDTSGNWHNELVRDASAAGCGYPHQWYYTAPTCAVTPDETVHLVYEQWDACVPEPGYLPIRYQYKPSGGSWTSPVDLTANPPLTENRDPSLFVDKDGGVHATWRRFDGNPDYGALYRYAPTGQRLDQVSSVFIPHPPNSYTGLGDVYVDKFSRVHRVMESWDVSVGGCAVDYTFKNAGGGWLDPATRPSINKIVTELDVWPAVAADNNRTVYVAYNDIGVNTLYVSVSPNGSSWTRYTIDNASSMGNQHVKPAMAVTSQYLYMMWRTDNPSFGNYDELMLAYLLNPSLVQVTAPNGGESWIRYTSQSITWTASGVTANVNIELWKDGSKLGDIATNRPITPTTYSWSVGTLTSGSALPGTGYRVRVATVDGQQSDDSDNPFTIISEIETVSTPTTPDGTIYGYTNVSYPYASGGAVSNHGHALEYRFDWGDGNFSSWSSSTSASHTWTGAGSYSVKAQARCATHTSVVSEWSTGLPVNIAVPGQYFNSPANRVILPEVNWAPASGGGTWIVEAQIVDRTGGSQVSVYYNHAGGRRGPFLLWTGGTAASSVKFSNLLDSIDQVDSGAFTYYGTIGAVEFVTQDTSHLIQVSMRQCNGNYSKTHPGLADWAANSADTTRQMVIPNLMSNAAFRSFVACFNPSADSVTVEFRLVGGDGSQVGSTIMRTFSGYGYQSFNVFTEAGVPYPGSSYDNTACYVQPTSGTGRIIMVGASSNNTTNDPAAHLAVQAGTGYENSPSNRIVLPEVNWAAASGGGTWVVEAQVIDRSGGSQVSVYYNHAGGRRGPFLLWTGGAAGSSYKTANLLQEIDNLDSGAFTYYGTIGAVEFVTQDASHLVQASMRQYNGNYSKTHPGLADVAANTASTSRLMGITNLTSNATYRSFVTCFNPSADSVTVAFALFSGNGTQIGSTFSRTLSGYGYQSFNVFTEAGVPYPGSSFDNVVCIVQPTSGSGRGMLVGASSNNTTNDPAAHVAVQVQ